MNHAVNRANMAIRGLIFYALWPILFVVCVIAYFFSANGGFVDPED